MKISVETPDKAMLLKKGVFSWPIWEKEISRFDWYYDSTEECYLLTGRVAVTTPEGDTVTFGAGDYVVFPEGLSCVWEVREPVKKHYNFR